MRRLVIFSILGTVLMSAASVIQAGGCAGITNDSQRLSCFDTARDCAGISAAETRLACFDELYGDSDKASVTFMENSRVASKTVENKAAETAVVSNTATEIATTGHKASNSTVLNRAVEESVDSKEMVNESLVQNTAPVEGANEAQFGKKKEFTDPAVYIEAKIVDVMRNAQKIDYIRLDNGHIWREYKDYRTRYKVGQKVIIEEGVLGSYNLKIEGVKKLIKVKRMN